MEFIKGTSESCVPDVKLTRARDGSSGTAVFFFEAPDVFEAGVAEQAGGDITGLYLVVEEGTLSTVDVSEKFVNGKPKGIEARYTMKSAFEWDRFMRFMERYAEDHGALHTRARGAPCGSRPQTHVGAHGRRGGKANTRQALTPSAQACTATPPRPQPLLPEQPCLHTRHSRLLPCTQAWASPRADRRGGLARMS
jgi:photosystem II protein